MSVLLGASLIAGFAVGVLWSQCRQSRQLREPTAATRQDRLMVQQLLDKGEYKMIIVVQNGLKMGKGKACAQAAHGACSALKSLMQSDPLLLEAWEYCGQAKVVVKVETHEELEEVEAIAKSLGLPTHSIRDAGRTQIAAGSKTVVAIGPALASELKAATGHLKLY